VAGTRRDDAEFLSRFSLQIWDPAVHLRCEQVTGPLRDNVADNVQAGRWRWRCMYTRPAIVTGSNARTDQAHKGRKRPTEGNGAYLNARRKTIADMHPANPESHSCTIGSPIRLDTMLNETGHDRPSGHRTRRHNRRRHNISRSARWRAPEAGKSIHCRGPPPARHHRRLRHREDGGIEGGCGLICEQNNRLTTASSSTSSSLQRKSTENSSSPSPEPRSPQSSTARSLSS
jgi:hypothetical protein